MRRLVIFASLLLAATVFGQQLVEKIDVNLVNVDVTVTSKGSPVSGLTRDDFEIFEDGRRQTITNFYASETTPAVVASSPAPAAVARAAVPQQDPRFRRRVLVLVDNNHTTRHSRDRALSELEAMINDRFHGDYDWSIGVIGRGVTLLLPLSSDKRAIHEALEIIRRAGTRAEGTSTFAGAADRGGLTLSPTDTRLTTMAVFDADYSERLEQAGNSDDEERAIAAKFTVPAILDAARGFAGSSGRKIVFLLTGDPGLNDINLVTQGGADGFGVRGVSSGSPNRFSNHLWNAQKTIADLRESIIEEANASDVSFYIWNVEGLTAPGGDMGATSSAPALTNNSAMFWLANQTGGRLLAGNNPAQSVQEFDSASSSFYSLGYKPAHPDDGKYHAISVRVKRKGDYALAYRSGYSDSSTATQLARAMKSPTAAAMDASTLPVTLILGKPPQTDGGEVAVPIEVKVPFRALQFLPGKSGVGASVVVYVSVFDDIGKNLVATSIPLTPGFKSGTPDPNGTLVYRNVIKLSKGARDRVVVAVRDTATDSIGMATQVVKY